MPGKHVPQDKFVAPHSVAEQRAPDNACGRFGKTTWRSLQPACPLRLDRRENIIRRDLRISAQEDPFGSHGDAGEMPAAVAQRLSDECQLSFANALGQIRPQLLAPDRRSLRANIVGSIDLPPWIENCPLRGRLQKV